MPAWKPRRKKGLVLGVALPFFRKGLVHRHRRLILTLSFFAGFLLFAAVFLYMAASPVVGGALGGLPAGEYVIFVAVAAGLLALSAYIARLLDTRVTAHRKLEEQALFQQAILDTMVDGLIISDEEGKILSANKTALNIFAREEKDLLGENITVLMPEEYRTRHLKGFARYRKTGIPKILGKGVIEVEGLNSKGRRIDLEVAANARDAMPSGGDLTIEISAVDVGPGRATRDTIAPGKYVLCHGVRYQPCLVLLRLSCAHLEERAQVWNSGRGSAEAL